MKTAFVRRLALLVSFVLSSLAAHATFTDSGYSTSFGSDYYTWTGSNGHAIYCQIHWYSGSAAPMVWIWDLTGNSPTMTWSVGNLSGTGIFGPWGASNDNSYTEKGFLAKPFYAD